MAPPSQSSSLTHWASQESPLCICPQPISVFLSVPCCSVGKAITLVKYNYPWILSLHQGNWPNLEKINNCPGWLCFKDRTLISKAFKLCSIILPHTSLANLYWLLKNHFILPHTDLMLLILTFSQKIGASKRQQSSFQYLCVLTYKCLYQTRTCTFLALDKVANSPLDTLGFIPTYLLRDPLSVPLSLISPISFQTYYNNSH